MKRIGAVVWFAMGLIAALALAGPLIAQEAQQKQGKIRYTIRDLGTLGGTFSWAWGINENGAVDGFAYLPGDTAFHAFLWQKGVMRDLGTLGGAYSSPNSRPNEKGEVAGFAETLIPDPFGDHFCSFATTYTCPPVFWTHRVTIQLPTLGGINGIASRANNRGQIVGSVENSNPGCRYYFQQKAVIWQKGQIKELPTLVGDQEGYAVDINDEGQVTGWTTADCIVFHPVLWNKGRPIELGSLGGTFNFPSAVNIQSEVTGIATVSGDVTSHAFLWRKYRGISDLGTLPGDFSSSAWGLDNKGRVVGSSCDASNNCRAFLWQEGIMTDLNTLLPADSQWFLYDAESINSRGEIVGLAFNLVTGEGHAYLATPRGGGSSSDLEALAIASESRPTPRIALPEHIRQVFQEQRNRRLGVQLPPQLN